MVRSARRTSSWLATGAVMRSANRQSGRELRYVGATHATDAPSLAHTNAIEPHMVVLPQRRPVHTTFVLALWFAILLWSCRNLGNGSIVIKRLHFERRSFAPRNLNSLRRLAEGDLD